MLGYASLTQPTRLGHLDLMVILCSMCPEEQEWVCIQGVMVPNRAHKDAFEQLMMQQELFAICMLSTHLQ
ncbi:MAG: hypothetical protein A2V21_305905 [Deltaproteobacteria bacterium GWC2_55_46]|nr:MAG: hypothetical protein A2V21_305905 [Deltaproteobacteria bacterium GWC2_55_46]